MSQNQSHKHFPIDRRVWPAVFLLIGLGTLSFFFVPPKTTFFSALFLIILHMAFFRDPIRSPDGEGLLSPADGKVVEVSFCDESRFLHGKAVKIGIFLSIFDVHVNRMPWSGTVEWIEHVPGKFLNAMDPQSAVQNECVWIGCRDGSRKFVVRPISGLIARHIHWDIEKGEKLARGQKIGIICYGSRTELYLPAEEFQPLVRVGDVVKSSKTVVGIWK